MYSTAIIEGYQDSHPKFCFFYVTILILTSENYRSPFSTPLNTKSIR